MRAEEISELLDLYRSEMSKNLTRLEAAIKSGNAKDVELIAHNCAGTSANCGMVAVVTSLLKLEQMGRAGQLAGALALTGETHREFERINYFLKENFEPVAV